MSVVIDGTSGVTTPGVVNTAGETIATTLAVTGATNLAVSSGNVGIGTASPAAKLDVYVTRTSSTSAVAITLSDNVTGVQTNGVYKSIRSSSNSGASASEIRFLETDGTNNNTGIAFATQASVGGGVLERGRFDNTGNFLFNSGYGSAATAYGCRAWVNFNGTGTVAIRASGNVSSITDNAVGNYTVNFTTSIADANYCPQITGDSSGARQNVFGRIANLAAVPTVSALQVIFCDDQSTLIDTAYAQVAIFR